MCGNRCCVIIASVREIFKNNNTVYFITIQAPDLRRLPKTSRKQPRFQGPLLPVLRSEREGRREGWERTLGTRLIS